MFDRPRLPWWWRLLLAAVVIQVCWILVVQPFPVALR